MPPAARKPRGKEAAQGPLTNGSALSYGIAVASQMMMEKNGLKVQVCAIYLPGKAADASILLDGVTPAAPDAMGAAIVAPGTSLLTF